MEIDIAAGDDENRPAESFRTDVERLLEALHGRLSIMETAAGVDSETGNNAAGMLRTFDARLVQMETNVAENMSAVLRLADSFKAEVARLEAEVKALQTATQPTS